tara:strand:+ start:2572 stop:2811 length:240 start_codon:yes stop_codon:yes gene_type:complete
MKKQTLNKDGTPRKTGSGRKKGSNCYQMVTIKQLKQFITEDFKIPVKRLWLENIVDNTTPDEVESIAPKTEEKIEFTLS